MSSGTVINVTNGSKARLTLSNVSLADAAPGSANGLDIPLIQDVTVTATPGTVRYSTLDSDASSAFTTVNENSVSLNILVDGETFFGNADLDTNSVSENGLFGTSKNKTEVFFSVAFEGTDSGARYITGKGFIGGLAPTASVDQAVWITPMEIIVNGELAALAIA